MQSTLFLGSDSIHQYNMNQTALCVGESDMTNLTNGSVKGDNLDSTLGYDCSIVA